MEKALEIELEEKLRTEKELKRQKVAKPLLWFGMASIVMLFAGLTSAVIVRKGDGNWLEFELPSMFLNSTAVILLSSITLIYAYLMARKDKLQALKLGLSVTLLLGVLFVVFQLIAYGQLYEGGIFMTGPGHNASGSFLYIISWVHIAHLIGGIISLVVVLFNAFREQYNSKNLLGLQLCSIYWHFLGALWIYLYVFFNVII